MGERKLLKESNQINEEFAGCGKESRKLKDIAPIAA